ncbi:hypothetical protein V8G54_025184 [Vigna mungo]|uniref:Uncharacterized protein n=1 Tax=Vigna mungo TaxID=3915 RepID=A0AAQ3N913_VIGMU
MRQGDDSWKLAFALEVVAVSRALPFSTFCSKRFIGLEREVAAPRQFEAVVVLDADGRQVLEVVLPKSQADKKPDGRYGYNPIDGRERESATNPVSAGSQCHIQRHHTSDSPMMKASMSQAGVDAFTIPHRRDLHREQPCHCCQRTKHVTTQSLFFMPQAASFKPPLLVLLSRNVISSEQLHLLRDT